MLELKVEIFLITFFVGYFIGSIPFAYIFTKLFSKKDLRVEGSGNVGMTNALRTAGILPAILTLIFDSSKPVLAGLIAFKISKILIGNLLAIIYVSGNLNKLALLIVSLTGLFAVFGHCYSVFLKFKGGKGAASMLGLMTFINPMLSLIGIIIWLIIFNLTHIVSVSTIIMLVSYPISAYFLHIHYFNILIYIIGTLSVFGIVMHGKNIKRLLTKSERKTYIFKKNV